MQKPNKPFKFNDNGNIREINASSWLKAFREIMSVFPHLGSQRISEVNLTEVKS